MKKVINMVVAAAVLAGASVTLAEDATLGFSAGADYLSKYVWRGQNLSDDPVFQPSVGATYGPLSLSLWGNMDTTNINGNSGDFSELDTTLGLAGDIPGVEGVGYTLGLIYYDFPGTSYPDTTEVYAGISLALPLSPSVTIYRDIDEAKGTYYAFGLSHSIDKIAELGADMPVGLSLGASVGYANSAYNKYYWGVDSSEAQDLTLTASFPTTIGGWTITPKMGYSTLLSGDISDSDAYGTSSDNFFAGIGASISF
jgi:hypothetical protein